MHTTEHPVLKQLRTVIERDATGTTSLTEVSRAIDAADEFESEYGYLPVGFRNWRDKALKKIKRETEAVDNQAIKQPNEK